MTLHTKIAVLGPVDVHELFAWGNEHLLHIDNPRTYDRQERIIDYKAWIAAGRDRDIDEFSTTVEGGNWTIGNEIGQGFDAIFDIDYRPDGPLYPTDMYYDKDYDLTTEPTPDEDGEIRIGQPACYAMISFDTAYGYDADGVDCSQLHARYIVQLWHHLLSIQPKTLENPGMPPLKWYNEFNGKWYDSLQELVTLTSSGEDAVEWFKTILQSAILSMT